MAGKGNKTTSMMRFAGLATQLLALLGIAVWGGIRLDQRMRIRALFVILLPVIALAVFLIQLIRSLNNKKDL
jgi:hypothetical protein